MYFYYQSTHVLLKILNIGIEIFLKIYGIFLIQ